MIRFRPIMMTTMAALMGTLPIALGFGAGAESRRPLGLAVVGGLVFSQMLTLFVTPVFYLYMERFRSWLGRHKARAALEDMAVEPEPASEAAQSSRRPLGKAQRAMPRPDWRCSGKLELPPALSS